MTENGPAVRSACSFSTQRCHLSGDMELHMSKWFQRSLTQSVCPEVSLLHTLPLGSNNKGGEKGTEYLRLCCAEHWIFIFLSLFFFFFFLSLRCYSCFCFCFVPTCTPRLSEKIKKILTCSGNLTRAHPSVFQQHPRQYHCSGRAYLQALLANLLDLSFSVPSWESTSTYPLSAMLSCVFYFCVMSLRLVALQGLSSR